MPNNELEIDFILFFCAMISRQFYQVFGGLAEEFGYGFGEDVEYSKRAVWNGWKVLQVPIDNYVDNLFNHGDNFICGNFPIFHKGEITVNDIPDWGDITKTNSDKLKWINETFYKKG